MKTRSNLITIAAALVLAALATATSLAGSAQASGTTYVCVNKANSLVYFKSKCAKTERRVAFTSAIKGANGLDGAAGESAYETWRKAGNLGTTADFLRSLKGTDGSAGPAGQAGSSANLPFFGRLEAALTCDEKWRTITTSVYATNQSEVDREQALAGCAQPDWALQAFQVPTVESFTLISNSYGTPQTANQQTRVNNVVVDNPYAPTQTTVSFSAVVEAHPPTGWALCTQSSPQITFTGGSGYPKIGWDDANGVNYFTVSNNRATITGTLTFANTIPIASQQQSIFLVASICGPDASTPSGLGIKQIVKDLALPAVN